MKQYLVIDIGGTAFKYALMDAEANFIEKGEIPAVHAKDAEPFFEAMATIVPQYKDRIEGIALSMPGRLDREKGYAYTSGALGYLSNTDVKGEFEKRFGITTFIENDGKAACLAEMWKGNLKDVRDGVVLILGTGIGGGIMLNRQLWRGWNGAAGEFSVLTTDFHPATLAAGWWANINGTPSGLVHPYAKAMDLPVEEVNGKIFFQALHEGNDKAKAIFDTFVENAVTAIYDLQCVLDVQKYCIGGGISAQNILIDSIRQGVDAYYEKYQHMIPMCKPEVDRCQFNNDANLIGALKNFFDLSEAA